MEVLPERGLFGGVSLQGTIFRFDACYLARLNLEDMGAGEMQAFRVARNQEQAVDGGSAGGPGVGPQPRLPALSHPAGDGTSFARGVSSLLSQDLGSSG